MTYELITVTTQARVGIITLNRPKQLNALNDQLMDEMGKALGFIGRSRAFGRWYRPQLT